MTYVAVDHREEAGAVASLRMSPVSLLLVELSIVCCTLYMMMGCVSATASICCLCKWRRTEGIHPRVNLQHRRRSGRSYTSSAPVVDDDDEGNGGDYDGDDYGDGEEDDYGDKESTVSPQLPTQHEWPQRRQRRPPPHRTKSGISNSSSDEEVNDSSPAHIRRYSQGLSCSPPVLRHWQGPPGPLQNTRSLARQNPSLAWQAPRAPLWQALSACRDTGSTLHEDRTLGSPPPPGHDWRTDNHQHHQRNAISNGGNVGLDLD